MRDSIWSNILSAVIGHDLLRTGSLDSAAKTPRSPPHRGSREAHVVAVELNLEVGEPASAKNIDGAQNNMYAFGIDGLAEEAEIGSSGLPGAAATDYAPCFVHRSAPRKSCRGRSPRRHDTGDLESTSAGVAVDHVKCRMNHIFRIRKWSGNDAADIGGSVPATAGCKATRR